MSTRHYLLVVSRARVKIREFCAIIILLLKNSDNFLKAVQPLFQEKCHDIPRFLDIENDTGRTRCL